MMNSKEQRFRAAIRILLYFSLIVLCQTLYYVIPGASGLSLSSILYNLVVVIGISIIAAKKLDRRSIWDLGIKVDRTWLIECFVGSFVAVAAMGGIFAISYSMNWLEIQQFGYQRGAEEFHLWNLIPYFGMMVAVSIYEELSFRGYILLNLSEGFFSERVSSNTAIGIALIISSFLFGLIHLGNPSSNWVSTAQISLAGLMLGLPFIWSGRLAFSMGLHFGWNFSQGGIFGFPVSGLMPQSSIIQIKMTGPANWTGGSFGPEAGLTGLFAILLIILCSGLYFRSRNIKTLSHQLPLKNLG